eukprot:7308180-Alexandrium_andersonii.AAC.1
MTHEVTSFGRPQLWDSHATEPTICVSCASAQQGFHNETGAWTPLGRSCAPTAPKSLRLGGRSRDDGQGWWTDC